MYTMFRKYANLHFLLDLLHCRFPQNCRETVISAMQKLYIYCSLFCNYDITFDRIKLEQVYSKRNNRNPKISFVRVLATWSYCGI